MEGFIKDFNYIINITKISLKYPHEFQLITAEGLSSNGFILEAREYKYG
jgi:hypothetical protein